MNLFDTHAHLGDEQFSPDREDVLRRAAVSGVGRIVEIADSPADLQAMREIIHVSLGSRAKLQA